MLKKYLKNQKGLTLVELLAVIVILGIIAAIAVPTIGNVINNAREDAVKADALSAIDAARILLTSNPEVGADGVTKTELTDYYDGSQLTAFTVNTDGSKVTSIDFKANVNGKDYDIVGATIDDLNNKDLDELTKRQ